MITTQLNSQLTVLSTLSVSQAGGDQTLAADINEKALKYLSDYAEKTADGKSTANLLEDAAEWVDEAVADIVTAKPTGASTESVFAAIASNPDESAAALGLHDQLAVLSKVTADQVGGDQALAEAVNAEAAKYIEDYNEKLAKGKSTESLEADAAKWIEEAAAEIHTSRAIEALEESLFAVAAAEPSTGSTTEAEAAPTASASASTNQAAAAGASSEKSASEESSAASSKTDGEKSAAKSRDAKEGHEGATAAGRGNGAKSDKAEGSEAGAAGAWGAYMSRQAENPAKAERRDAAIAAAEGALKGKRDTFDLDALKSDEGPADPRLEAMKRALSQLKTLPEDVGRATLNGLSANANAEAADPQDAFSTPGGPFAGGAPAQKDSFIKAAVAYASARAATAS